VPVYGSRFNSVVYFMSAYCKLHCSYETLILYFVITTTLSWCVCGDFYDCTIHFVAHRALYVNKLVVLARHCCARQISSALLLHHLSILLYQITYVSLILVRSCR